MSSVPGNLRYTRTHEWVRPLSDGTVEIGISDRAQQELGDLVFVDLPEAGREVKAGEAFAVVESVKAASDVHSPLAGTVIAANTALTAEPELINHDAYGKGWMVKLRAAKAADVEALLSPGDYATLLHEAAG